MNCEITNAISILVDVIMIFGFCVAFYIFIIKLIDKLFK